MDLAQLIGKLDSLCKDPQANEDEITALLDANDDLAEFEVARFFVADALGGDIVGRLRSRDPQERLRAVRWIRLTYPRAEAGRLLRRVYKDPDPAVRGHARFAANQLGLRDIALPDSLSRPGWSSGSTPIGGWNRTGWSFGLYRHQRARRPSRRDLLKQYRLPALATPAAVAELVGLDSDEELARFLRPGVGPGAPYVEFEIPKASGGQRRISAPRHALKTIQQTLLREILARLPVHDACHGFVPGRSTVSNAEPHQNARVVIKMDLLDFFPSIHYRRVAGLFEHYGYGHDVAHILAGLTTHRAKLDDGRVVWPGVMPQGAPTSPAIANLVCRRLDMRLAGLASRVGARYTRYADDLTFSFADDSGLTGGVGRFCWWVEQICQQEGFVENTGKRRVLRRGNQQRVTGVVVNSGLSVPRKARRRFRAILANCRKHGVASQARGRDDFPDYLRGYAAYIKMVQPELGARMIAEVEAVLARDPGHAGSPDSDAGDGGHDA